MRHLAFLIAMTLLCVIDLAGQPFAGLQGRIEHHLFSFPVQFTENAGQWPSPILFAATRPSLGAYFTKEGFGILARGYSADRPLPIEHPIIRLQSRIDAERPTQWMTATFLHPSSSMRVHGSDPLQGVSHFYYGNAQDAWRENVRNYTGLWYRNVWNGVDIGFEEHGHGLRQIIEVLPGGRLLDVRIECPGLDTAEIAVSARVSDGDGHAVPVISRLRAGVWSFTVPAEYAERPLVVYTDFATFLLSLIHI